MVTVDLLAPLFRNLAQDRHGVHFLVAGPVTVRRALAELAFALTSPDGVPNGRLAALHDNPGQGPFNGAQIVPADLGPNDFTVTLAWVEDAETAAWLAEGLRLSRSRGRAVVAVITPELLDDSSIAGFVDEGEANVTRVAV